MMLILQVTYVLLAAVVVFLMFYSRLSYLVKASALTLSVLLGALAQSHYVKLLGSPIQGFPSYEFVYVHHTAVGGVIKLWIWDEGLGDRLYIIPYDQDTAQELEEAQKESEKGTPQSGQFSEEETGSDKDQSPSLELDDWAGDKTETEKEVRNDT